MPSSYLKPDFTGGSIMIICMLEPVTPEPLKNLQYFLSALLHFLFLNDAVPQRELEREDI